MTDPDTILLEAEDTMEKAVAYLKNELRGIRTGRASTAMIDFVKVDYYGAATDLKALALISVPEPTQLLVKPFDAASIGEIKKAIEAAGLGLNPNNEGGKQLRISVPPLSGDRRQQLVSKVRKDGEEQKVAIRNVRRDANKHADGLKSQPGKHVPEDEIETLKTEIQSLLKKYEGEVDRLIEGKIKEITEV
ncbi:MAG: ribosome recycling factor [Phycisphaerales bacterium]|nr:ribosome recycling factor [Phycisphaerales bacterium]